MQLIICEDSQEASLKASEIVIQQLQNNPKTVLGLATGSTPIGLYKNLIDAFKKGKISFKDVVSYNLDEYLGIDRNHKESYYQFMHTHLFNHIDIKEENAHLPSNNLATVEQDIKAYNEALLRTQIDLQILGIGGNGHIGFNEPGSPFENETFAVDLTEQTRRDNLRFFNHIDEVPKRAVTMGIKTILRSKKIILIATGKNKADAIYKMVKGPVTPSLPASALQEHPDVVVILDKEAASLL